MRNDTAYQRTYHAQRRATFKAQGRCVECGGRRRAGVDTTGWRFTRCARCRGLKKRSRERIRRKDLEAL